MTDGVKGSCAYCGVTVESGNAYCSSACDLIDRIPRGETALPASGQLGAALGVFFLLFNQMMFVSLVWLKRGSEDVELVKNLLFAAVVSGVLVFLSNVVVFSAIRKKRALDWLLAFVAFGATAWTFGQNGEVFSIGFQTYLLVFNLLVISWLSRGLIIRKPVKKQQKARS